MYYFFSEHSVGYMCARYFGRRKLSQVPDKFNNSNTK